ASACSRGDSDGRRSGIAAIRGLNLVRTVRARRNAARDCGKDQCRGGNHPGRSAVPRKIPGAANVRANGEHATSFRRLYRRANTAAAALPPTRGWMTTTKLPITIGKIANTPEANEPIQWLAVVTTATTTATAAARSGRS